MQAGDIVTIGEDSYTLLFIGNMHLTLIRIEDQQDWVLCIDRPIMRYYFDYDDMHLMNENEYGVKL